MSVFTENAWDKDETGDKLVKELFATRKKKAKAKAKTGKNAAKPNKKVREKNVDKEVGPVNETSRGNSTPSKKRKHEVVDSSSKEISKKKRKHSQTNSKLETESAIASTKKSKQNSQHAGAKSISNKIQTNAEKPNVSGSLNGQNNVTLTKSQKRRLKHEQKLLANSAPQENVENKNSEKNANNTANLSKSARLKIDRLTQMLATKQENAAKSKKSSMKTQSLRDRMMARLKSSRFRYLNEQMYNSQSTESRKYFKEDPEAFAAYHEGYKLQVDQWPLNPLDTIIASLKKMPKEYVVADFGCGEAKLSESIPQKVHSLDLVAINERVTACDMAHTPLLSGRIDVVVFCLSLMGTNLSDYFVEANRVLRKDGILKLAEVESRFENVDEFIKNLQSYGFINTRKDFSHNLFHFMDFKKDDEITKKRNKLPVITLKSCLYKKR